MLKVHITILAGMVAVYVPETSAGAEELFPVYVVWDTHDTRYSTVGPRAYHWASTELELGVYDLPPGGSTHSPTKLVEPYPHLQGEALMVSRTPGVEFHKVFFREVKDDDEYLRRLKDVEAYYVDLAADDPNATLRNLGPPERRQIAYERNWMEQVTEKVVREIRGYKTTIRLPVRLADGTLSQRQVARNRTVNQFVKRDGDLLINGETEGVFDIPQSALTRRRTLQDDDRTYFVDVAGLPKQTRKMIWDQVLATKNTELQKFDNEDEADYQARRSLGENWIELMRAVLFDIDSAWASFNYRDDSQPVQGRGAVDVAADTELQTMLRRIGRVRSRLPLMEHDNEVFFVHWTSRLPDETAKFLQAAANLLRTRYPAADFLDTLDYTVEDGIFELQLSGRADPEFGLACLGAVRITDESDNAQKALSTFLSLVPELAAQQIVSDQGESFVRITLESLAKIKAKMFPDRGYLKVPKYAYLHADQNILWVSLGGENAWKLLEPELSREDESVAGETPRQNHLLECRVNLELATGDAGSASGLAEYLKTLEHAFTYWTMEKTFFRWKELGRNVKLPSRDSIKLDPVSQKALAGRPARAALWIDLVPDGMRGEIKTDRSLALFYYGILGQTSKYSMDAAREALGVFK